MWFYVMFPLSNTDKQKRLHEIKKFEAELRDMGYTKGMSGYSIFPDNAATHFNHSYWLLSIEKKQVFFLKTRDNNAKLVSMGEFRHMCRGTLTGKKFGV
jgi:hypothetical protein